MRVRKGGKTPLYGEEGEEQQDYSRDGRDACVCMCMVVRLSIEGEYARSLYFSTVRHLISRTVLLLLCLYYRRHDPSFFLTFFSLVINTNSTPSSLASQVLTIQVNLLSYPPRNQWFVSLFFHLHLLYSSPSL